MNDCLDLLFESDRGKDPALLAHKWERLQKSGFKFFRGSTKLFYHHWAKQSLPEAPIGWICGDVHLENAGRFTGKNHVAYFDLSDFDEVCLAPLHYDLGRALTGLAMMKMGHFRRGFIAGYREALTEGKPYHVEPEVATGTVARLLTEIKQRSRKKFLTQWIHKDRIIEKEGETFRLPVKQRNRVARIFNSWAKNQPKPDFYHVLDICGSISGVGSIGHERYLVLVAGKKLPHLIDMKEAGPASAAEISGIPQPIWENEAERVATVQFFMQYLPIARLGWTKSSFVLSEFQSTEDRIDCLSLSEEEYDNFIRQWGRLVAWAHLRCTGWRSTATTDVLIEYGKSLTVDRQEKIIRASSQSADYLMRAFNTYRDYWTKYLEPGAAAK